jgi:hypothetical protein
LFTARFFSFNSQLPNATPESPSPAANQGYVTFSEEVGVRGTINSENTEKKDRYLVDRPGI